MRFKRQKYNSFEEQSALNLDSLVDIISNTLGVIILLMLISFMLPKNLSTNKTHENKIIVDSKKIVNNYTEIFSEGNKTLVLPHKHLTDNYSFAVIFLYKNQVIFADTKSILIDNLSSEHIDLDNRFIYGDYIVGYEKVPIGDAGNVFLEFTLAAEGITINEKSNLKELIGNDFLKNYPPKKTLAIVISYPSGHHLFPDMIKYLKDNNYLVSWYLEKERFTFYFGQSYQGIPVESD